MWIGDVGQDTVEEIDLLKADQIAGKNLGWSMYEAANCFNGPCDATGKMMPQISRTHTAGWKAIIGGEVYRGTCYPDLVGKYFFSDNTKNILSTATLSGDTVTATDLPAPQGGWPAGIASIHGDARGELYLTTATGSLTTSGRIYHIEAGP
jgi:hypothetical protein